MPAPPSLPVQTFLQEAQEVLEALETRLLELEDDPQNGELIDAVFRNLHTLKGSGEMFGFSALAGFTHSFENAYDAVRAGRAPITQALIDVSLRARDHIQRLIDAGTDPEVNAELAAAPEGAALLADLAALTDGEAEERAAPGSSAEAPGKARNRAGDEASFRRTEAERASQRWRIRFRPAPDTLRKGLRPDLLVDELAELGTAEIRVIASAVPNLDEIDPTRCYLAWDIALTTGETREAIEDVFLFADDADLDIVPEPDIADASGECADAAPPAGSPPGDSLPADLLITDEPAAGPPEAKSAAAPDGTAARGGPGSPAHRAQDAARPASPKSESVRVQSERLDALMDQLGELVIAQARLNRISQDLGDAALIATAEEIERLITGLRDATLSIRMLPIGGVFGKFRRLVRDLSGELGKQVTLVTEGGETELDKNVIDCLSEPLVHIIRNSVDHGVERTQARIAAGKAPQATVSMTAEQAGGEVLITVADDGGGLDTGAIRARAEERGIILPGEELSESELQQLIFAPGFSTAKTVSNVSGRGVGMDAVRSVIGDLGGEVVVASRRGEGTRVTLRLPLTLAIIEGLLVRVGSGNYVLPLSGVDECVDLGRGERRRESGRAILTIRDELVPFLDLHKVFGFEAGEPEDARKIVIVRVEQRRVGLLVDDILGQHQTVIKSLSIYHRTIPGLAGGTILGDGAVALILDPAALVKNASATLNEAA